MGGSTRDAAPSADLRVLPGRPVPLGARWDGEGVNFAVFSEGATRVALCLYDDEGEREIARISLPERSGDVWHGYLPGVRPGQRYGYRVHGPWAPDRGQRYNPAKLLVDPYARALDRPLRWNDAFYGVARRDPPDDAAPNGEDSAPFLPRSVVVDDAFDWENDRPPRLAWERTVLYECHVKGMTRLHPDVPEEQRGRFLGLACEPVIDHLRRLGVTTLELMPVQMHGTDPHLAVRGLANYWGYNTLAFFAPDVRFASEPLLAVTEFKTLVKRLHAAGLELILDVVYNHTCEGGPLGPTLSWRGFDDAAYYRRLPQEPRSYEDVTGCGNTLDVRHSRVLQMVLDSLRYWVGEMHVDGFRFDLAPALVRDPDAPEGRARFLEIVRQDPLLSQVKLVAEPWDLGPDGHQLGGFPYGWSEWNDRYRDTVRRFWRGDRGQVPELASRISGSSDLFEPSGRGPQASVNYVTCHDGFTLRDLVSYERKHNESNGEENRDGSDHNASRNWGVEGETDAHAVLRLRDRTQRNLLATLFLSQGIPMLSHGDELGRTQRGNNNAYCQDNEISWVDWSRRGTADDHVEWMARLAHLRHATPLLRRRHFFRGERTPAGGSLKDVSWLSSDGSEMTHAYWSDTEHRVIGMLISAHASEELDELGEPQPAHTLLLLLNGGARARYFSLPSEPVGGHWRELLNTAREPASPRGRAIRGKGVNLAAHSLILLAHERPGT